MKLRTLNKLYANFLGYFWLPCPLCGQMFGGHEVSFKYGASNHFIMIDWNRGEAACPDCARTGKVREYNIKWVKDHPKINVNLSHS